MPETGTTIPASAISCCGIGWRRSRRCTVRDRPLRRAITLAMLVGGVAVARAPASLPVYVEDSHAGSFYWMIRNLPLDRDYQLVLIDAHSDASEIFGSDSIRQQFMEAAGAGQLDSLEKRWRR